jgi:hypothetical protein
MNLKEKVQSIVDNSDKSNKQKMDELLRMDCIMYTNLGLDSTIKEIEETKKNSRIIYRGVQKIDYDSGSQMLRTQDAKKTA